ncbi:hypothetical protein EV421DRAFT_1743106 [Armillaria borealis]|uniref:Uncharacterized protein n=1 Tax=Armillaria borealis TaxID=47425 RepID=A0AA39IVV8_9AGAR|nr:hypothetical protein EV421DRAFT_1743106 [Armillaria borealis]
MHLAFLPASICFLAFLLLFSIMHMSKIKLRSNNTIAQKNVTAKPKPTQPAKKLATMSAAQEQSTTRKRQHQIISDLDSEVEPEDDAALVSKKGKKIEQPARGKKLGTQMGTQKTLPPPAASDTNDVEEDDTEEDMDLDAGSVADASGMVSGQGRKVKGTNDAELTQSEVKTARKQKHYKVLQQITSNNGEALVKRKENLEECIKILSDAHKWGKFMPRAINLWVEPKDVLLEGIERLLGSESTSENGANLNAYEALTSMWSIDLLNDLEYFVDADDGIAKISTALHKGFKSGCQEDTHKIRKNILKIIVKDPRKELLPLPAPVIKSAQGFNYSETARLFCPQIYLEMFKNNDKWRQQLCEGKIKISHWELPSFLFDQSKVSSEDALAGCMEGYVLVRMVKHLLTSNGIPGRSKGLTCPPITKIYKITKIMGHIIAYGACQAHYAFSSVDSWTRCDGKFDLQKFYEAVVDMYEDFPEDPWAIASLAWWNKEVFGNLDGADDDDDSDNTPPPESTVFKMAEAR